MQVRRVRIAHRSIPTKRCAVRTLPNLRMRAFWVLAIITIAVSASALAQTYPTKVIRALTTESGGGSDFNARLISQALSVVVGQQIVIDNRPGSISTETLVRANPDGYTILFNGAAVWLLPFLRDNVPYDPLRDLAPISFSTSAPCVLVIHPSVPAKTVSELIALAKSKPGELNYAAGVMGSPPHLAAELFNRMAGVKIDRKSTRLNSSHVSEFRMPSSA